MPPYRWSPHFSRRTVLAALGSTTAAALGPRLAAAQTTPVLRIGAVAGDTFAEPYYASDLGFFSKAGLNVEVTTLANGGAIAGAVAGGALDIGIGDIVALSNAINHGVPFMLIAGGALHSSANPTTFLCVDKASSIKSAKELEGKSVAVITLVGLNTAAAKAWLAGNGADISQIHFVELTMSEMPAALARGTVMAAAIGEPIYTNAKTDLRVLGVPFDAIAKQLLVSIFFTTRDWLARNGPLAKRFVGVVYDTARWANANQSATLPIIAKYTRSNLERLRGVARPLYATSLDAAAIQPVIDSAVKYKAVERPIDLAAVMAKV